MISTWRTPERWPGGGRAPLRSIDPYTLAQMIDGDTSSAEPRGPEADARTAVDEARQRLAEVPASMVVANHAMGLFELAAIHLSASPPNLSEAALAIDALSALVEGLGSRIGEHHETLVAALSNIRLVYVQKAG